MKILVQNEANQKKEFYNGIEKKSNFKCNITKNEHIVQRQVQSFYESKCSSGVPKRNGKFKFKQS